MMKKILKLTFITLCLLFTIKGVFAYNGEINLHLFYSKNCPHCAEEKKFLSTLNTKYPQIVVNEYEVTENRENMELFMKVGQAANYTAGAVPFLVIGDEFILGYSKESGFNEIIENAIVEAIDNNKTDMVENIKESNVNLTKKEYENVSIKLPIIGTINSSEVSLPLFTFFVALLDGFNPCAMWVLLFLISVLLGMQDRKKMFLLGTTFIFVSGLIYFLFLSAWLNLFILIGYAVAVRIIIGILALVIGSVYLKSSLSKKEEGCKVTNKENRIKIFEKIKKITQNKNIFISLAGISLLAVAVNVVELLCSAGLPAVYTNVLSMAGMTQWQYYSYLAFYVVIFMIDDIVIFTVAMLTLKAVGVKSKYSKYSHIIGGILMLLIGLALIFKPELLMFN